MLSRTLSGIVLTLALLAGGVLLISSLDIEAMPTKRSVSEDQNKTHILSFPSGILSKLSLFPFGSRNPSLVSVMIENHEDARPHHKGLEQAFMVEEFLVEGLISRFVALFDARKLPASVGPVRSLRPYFLDGIQPWSRMVFHAGGSPEALKRAQSGTDFYALNLLYFDGLDESFRDERIAAPHNLFMKRSFMKQQLADVPTKFLPQVSWPPFSTGVSEGGESAEEISVNFFNRNHNVTFEFLPLAQKYRRTNGQDVSPARPATVIILEVPIASVGEFGRLAMNLDSKGDALVFHSGKVWEGVWSQQEDPHTFTIVDADGEDISIAKGQIWLMALPTLDRVVWDEALN